MKKLSLLTFIAVLALSVSVKAQIQKGNVLVGGDLANLRLGLDNSKTVSFDIMPKAAWFVQDNLALGGYLRFGVQGAKNAPTTTTYGIGALGRYYAGPDMEVVRHGRFFGEANVGVGGSNTSDGGGKTNGLDLGFGPGFAYFITPNIGLETLLKYQGVLGFGNSTTQNALNLSFGFQIYLPGKATADRIKSGR